VNKPECNNKDCSQCETCIYDEPIDEHFNKINMNNNDCCNDCPYMSKTYPFPMEDLFHAYCNKLKINGKNVARALAFNANGDATIKKPSWCPLKCFSRKTFSQLSYMEKYNELERLPPQLEWEQIEVGKKYIIPSFLGRKRMIIQAKFKSDFVIVGDSLTGAYHENIFRDSLEARFITEYKKY